MLEVTESAFTFAVFMVIRQIVYFGFNQLLNSCYEMVEDHSVYCSVGLLSNAVLSVITMKVNAYINNMKK